MLDQIQELELHHRGTPSRKQDRRDDSRRSVLHPCHRACSDYRVGNVAVSAVQVVFNRTGCSFVTRVVIGINWLRDFGATFLQALHESRRRQAEREIQQHRHLIEQARLHRARAASS